MLNNKLIFVVDDEPALAEAIASFLELNGFEIAVFTSPAEAFKAAESQTPDLLLSDFKMQGMDGLTLGTRLTELHPECRVLLMSGVTQDTAAIPARKNFDFVQKPVSLARLAEKVKSMLAA